MCDGIEAPLSFSLRSEAFASLFSMDTLSDYLPAGRSAKETARDLYPASSQSLRSELCEYCGSDSFPEVAEGRYNDFREGGMYMHSPGEVADASS